MDESAVSPSLDGPRPGISGSDVALDGGGLVAVNTVVSDDKDTHSSKHKKTVKKRKTEPTNPYLQFVKSRKDSARVMDPQSKLNMKDVQREWGELTETEKMPFREMFQKEKGDMGNDFRNKGVREKLDKDENSNPLKKKRKSRRKGLVSNISKSVVEEEKSLMVRMRKFQKVEEEITKAELEAKSLFGEKLKVNIELAAKKTKFQMLTDSLFALKEKHSNINKIHKNCGL